MPIVLFWIGMVFLVFVLSVLIGAYLSKARKEEVDQVIGALVRINTMIFIASAVAHYLGMG